MTSVQAVERDEAQIDAPQLRAIGTGEREVGD